MGYPESLELPDRYRGKQVPGLNGYPVPGQNLERPFVDVVATNIPCDAHSITRLTHLVLSEYAQSGLYVRGFLFRAARIICCLNCGKRPVRKAQLLICTLSLVS